MVQLRQIYYSFPVRLMVLHWRNHLILIALWLFLGLLMTGVLGKFFGVHYLMLTPEYRGEVGFWSFFLSGMAFGIFLMIWNLTSYLLCSNRFPFLATLEAPFTKFCLNNALLPLTFFIVWLSVSIWFQRQDEFTSSFQILLNISGLVLGTAWMIFLLSGYFFYTNRDIIHFSKIGKIIPREGGKILVPGYRIPTLREIRVGITAWRVDTFLNERLRVRPVRSVSHYNQDILRQVFRQNHFNAVVVMMALLFMLMVLGYFMENEYCRIPTGATIFLLASMVMSFFGAITFWFRNWSFLVFVMMLLVLHWASTQEWISFKNKAYGIDYRQENRSKYDIHALEKMANPENIAADRKNTERILYRWLARNESPQQPKPRMVLLNVSGGGMRAALWTMHVLQQLNMATQGNFFKKTVLITGASGGMLGAAYFRELVYRGKNPNSPFALENISRDLLNPVSFGIIANDLLIPLSSFKSGNFTYRKDRGYLFERQFNENCENLMGKRLADYRLPEAMAAIPMMYITPYLLNDARRMLISPHPIRFMMRPATDIKNSMGLEIDGVDFGQFFAQQEADSLAFTSALRMNCTYPYILPNAWLPAEPMLEVLDAGFRDNYGTGMAARFVEVFKDWILEHTSGVLIIQVRCFEKYEKIEPSTRKGLLHFLSSPAVALGNTVTVQDFEQDQFLAFLQQILGEKNLDVVRFIYRPVKKSREASMNLHLSAREKLDILAAFYSEENKKSLEQVLKILKKRIE